MNLPKARSRNIVVQTLGRETLIYDLDVNRAFNLNETLSVVFRHCDGKTSVADLQRRYKYTDDLIHFALGELKAHDLLEDYNGNHFVGLSRREAIRKVGLGTMFAVPVIAGLVAPHAVTASSAGCAGGCNLPNATATCVAGNTCQITACNQGFADCNNSPNDGCETNLNNNVNNCGGCGNNCTVANGTPTCIAGTCQVASCNDPFRNCNGSASDGCETNLRTSRTNCGACGITCPNGFICVDFSCVQP